MELTRTIMIGAGVCLAAGAYYAAGTEPPPTTPGLVIDCRVVRVIDGDTIEVTPAPWLIRLRLLDCWAPETRTTDPAEKQRGLAAKQHLQQMLADGRCRIHVPAFSNRLDRLFTFGRVLGHGWILQDSGEVLAGDVSSRMVAAGHATAEKPMP